MSLPPASTSTDTGTGTESALGSPSNERSPGSDTPPASCDQQVWEQLLVTAPGPRTLDWMVRQAAGWHNLGFASRSELMYSLLAASLQLSRRHLAQLTGGDGVADVRGAMALLAHPSATMGTLTALTGSLMNSWGGPRFEPEWGGRAQEQIVSALLANDRPAVAVATKIRKQGLRFWHPDWASVEGLLRGVRQAHGSYAQAMAEIDRHGLAGWRIAEPAMLRAHGPDLVTLVHGVLGPPPAHASGPSFTTRPPSADTDRVPG